MAELVRVFLFKDGQYTIQGGVAGVYQVDPGFMIIHAG